MLEQIRPAISILIAFTVLTGCIYPGAVTVIAQLVCPHAANGSLIRQNGHMVGSDLIGQQFTNPKYFWGRVSATAPMAYNAAASSGANLGPTNPKLIQIVNDRIGALKAYDTPDGLVPVDLVTASASGLDPHISPAAADYQIPRVAKLRDMSETELRDLVRQHTEQQQYGLFGEPRVHVLRLNLALDQLRSSR